MCIINLSPLFPQLHDVIFAEKNPRIIESEIISRYEELSGRTLARGDPVRLFLESIVLVIIQQRNLIDYSAKMNLLAYSSGTFLDQLGALLGVYRLLPAHSTCTAQFTLSAKLNSYAVIPKGTRLSAGNFIFETTEELEIKRGDLTGTVIIQSQTAGSEANNLIPGQINNILDALPFDVKAQNITESYGGSEAENDENFRERIQLVPESFSNAGSKKGYEFYARSAHPDIIDVEVLTPPDTSPGFVEIYPLLAGGVLPSDEIIQAVYNSCNGVSVRPDTDFLSVKKAQFIDYNIDVKFWIEESKSNLASQIINAVDDAVNEFIIWQRSKLGQDINPSELNYRIIKAGAKRCEITEPKYKALKSNQVARLKTQSINYAGLEEK